ncbi:hypothetical protein [Stieleria varia]|uniref:HTTM domain-containing protein n=1 Tax=Stieleria varia TaxID=2528005 RepID=A0A5C6AUC0_9BACT|nr:hypothetical protein [Stieleria varia]TWU02799.1 hypothetical protein Pla52n_38580 [Stieleria varia]
MSETTKIESDAWMRFWFAPQSDSRLTLARTALCVVAAAYFVSSMTDLSYWFVDGRPAAAGNLAMFVRASGLDAETRWMLSPLYLIDALIGCKAWVYYTYLLAGVALSGVVIFGKGGRVAQWILWGVLVGWANRIVMLSGLVETLLSLGLFATAIGPPTSIVGLLSVGASRSGDPGSDPPQQPADWTVGFATRLLAVQFTLIAVLTTATMLASNIWWNGIGAYALAAPVQDRYLQITGGWFEREFVYEACTHVLVCLLPLGVALAWWRERYYLGKIFIGVWCLMVAFLGSHWLYAAAMFSMALAIEPLALKPLSHRAEIRSDNV